nr:PREDICTED: uncharacterized protein LOC109036072 isoform X2 [Bemisia tabaci]
MRVRLLGFWIWCLSGTNFPSIAGEISPQLRGELHTYMTYNPCHRMGLNRNAEDCSQSVGTGNTAQNKENIKLVCDKSSS